MAVIMVQMERESFVKLDSSLCTANIVKEEKSGYSVEFRFFDDVNKVWRRERTKRFERKWEAKEWMNKLFILLEDISRQEGFKFVSHIDIEKVKLLPARTFSHE